MRILMAGGSGFLGRALTSSLASAGHDVTILTRQAAVAPGARPDQSARLLAWNPDGTAGPWAGICGPIDAVINLAGESIAARRWSDEQKRRLTDSRVLSTRSLVAFARQASPPPALFVNASAIGYYGNAGDTRLDEEAAPGSDFLARLVVEWEREAASAAGPSTRVAFIRTGIVLDPGDGALAKMLPPFRLGAGGPFGAGRQYMSWIHRDDWVTLARWIVETGATSGAYNATAPTPVTNAEFAKTLGRVLSRPALVPTPPFALKIALGEMAEPLLLYSQRVLPSRATAAGFTFRFPDLEPALRDLLR